jgi:predicted metal-dependent phosphoesterase TrpH
VSVDLHIHSSASDGSLTPAEIIDRAGRLNLAAIALTDHDTLAGVKAVLTSGLPANLGFITGVEISTAAPEPYFCHGSLHLLGYGFDPDNDDLGHALQRLQDARNNRNPRIIAKLNRLGIPITSDALGATASDTQIGRPHIANWLVEHGIVADFDEAFERLLGNGRPAYVDKYRIGCEAAIRLIRKAGGVAVLAHPALITPRGDWNIENLVRELQSLGLAGIEAYYPEHTPAQTRTFLDWAARMGLVATGGTDFHGAIKPDVEMGVARGDFHVPDGCLAELIARVDKTASRTGQRPYSLSS